MPSAHSLVPRTSSLHSRVPLTYPPRTSAHLECSALTAVEGFSRLPEPSLADAQAPGLTALQLYALPSLAHGAPGGAGMEAR
eukprot:6480982-Prymnesium_polylepis.1